MILASRKVVVALVASAFTVFVSCSDKKAEEPVEAAPAAVEEPAAPAAPEAPAAPVAPEAPAAKAPAKKAPAKKPKKK